MQNVAIFSLEISDLGKFGVKGKYRGINNVSMQVNSFEFYRSQKLIFFVGFFSVLHFQWKYVERNLTETKSIRRYFLEYEFIMC